MSATYDVEWLIQDAWVQTLTSYRAATTLDPGVGIRHWTDVRTLPPMIYIMAHCTVDPLLTGNTHAPDCFNPATCEIGIFTATVPDSSGEIADRIRGLICHKIVPDTNFYTTFNSKLPAAYFYIGAFKPAGTHDYNEDPFWKIRYATFKLYGQFYPSGNYSGAQGPLH